MQRKTVLPTQAFSIAVFCQNCDCKHFSLLRCALLMDHYEKKPPVTISSRLLSYNAPAMNELSRLSTMEPASASPPQLTTTMSSAQKQEYQQRSFDQSGQKPQHTVRSVGEAPRRRLLQAGCTSQDPHQNAASHSNGQETDECNDSRRQQLNEQVGCFPCACGYPSPLMMAGHARNSIVQHVAAVDMANFSVKLSLMLIPSEPSSNMSARGFAAKNQARARSPRSSPAYVNRCIRILSPVPWLRKTPGSPPE